MSAIIKTFPRAVSKSPKLVPVETALQTFRIIRGDPPAPLAHAAHAVPDAAQIRAERLPQMLRVRRAEAELHHALSTRWMDQQIGAAIIGNLFRMLGIKPGDDPEALLEGALTALLSDELGKQTGSWRPVKATPVTLMIAAHQILQTAIFPPKPAEIVKACREVRKKLENAHAVCNQWLGDLQKADAVLLEFAPEQWASPYTLPQYQNALQAMLEAHQYAGMDDATYAGDFQRLVERERSKRFIMSDNDAERSS